MNNIEAKQKGYQALTVAYRPEEQEMLDSVMSDMKRGGVDTVIVETDQGPEVWRKDMKT